MDWPGLAREVQQICQLTGLPDATDKNTILDKASVEEAIKVSHLQYLKDNMKGKKLVAMKMTDMRERRQYTKLRLYECRIAFQLEVFQFECRANMPSQYKRDLWCQACGPVIGEQVPEGDQEQDENKQQEQQEEDQWNIEDQ